MDIDKKVLILISNHRKPKESKNLEWISLDYVNI